MFKPCWPHVDSMLVPCWLHVGSMLTHVGPSGLQDGSRCHYVDSGWPQDGQHGLQEQILINFCSCWNTLDFQHIKKSIGFKGPFAFCTFLFLLLVFEPLSCLKLAPSCLKLAYLRKFEAKLSQVGSKLVQLGAKLGPSWLHVGSCWALVGDKLAPSQLKLMLCWSQYPGIKFGLAQFRPRTPP